MAQPESLARNMSDHDLLELWCGDCPARFRAGRAQAVRRYGAGASPEIIRKVSRCRACGGRRVWCRVLVGAALRQPRGSAKV